MKWPLLAASLLALGGCVAPGYYVQPDYAGGGYYDDGGYYGGGYYDDGGYYPGYDEGCCSGSVSIGYGYGYPGYGYGYPGYYGWGGYPNGYGYYGGYYGRGGHNRGGHRGGHDGNDHHGGHDRDGHHGDDGHGGGHHDGRWWHGDYVDGAVKRWPSDRPWRDADRAPIPHWNAMAPSGNRPAPHMVSPGGASHFGPR